MTALVELKLENVNFKLLFRSKLVVKTLDEMSEVNNSRSVHFMNCLKRDFKNLILSKMSYCCILVWVNLVLEFVNVTYV